MMIQVVSPLKVSVDSVECVTWDATYIGIKSTAEQIAAGTYDEDGVFIHCYLVKQRRKQMVVYGIIGASKGRRLAMNEIEIMLISMVTVLIGFAVFKLKLENVIITVYECSTELYTAKDYLSMIAAYLGCIFGFTVVRLYMINKDKLADMLRRANSV